MENVPQIETSKKDFPNVLSRVPVGIGYAISELEFEFGLPWEHLKPLFDKYCSYEENNGIIKITHKKTEEDLKDEAFKKHKKAQEKEDRIKNEARKKAQEKLKEILNQTFYKRGKYLSMKKQNWPQEHAQLLEECIELGIIKVWTHHGKKPMLVLHGHYPSHNNKMRD